MVFFFPPHVELGLILIALHQFNIYTLLTLQIQILAEKIGQKMVQLSRCVVV